MRYMRPDYKQLLSGRIYRINNLLQEHVFLIYMTLTAEQFV
jgi:hypothetical protein